MKIAIIIAMDIEYHRMLDLLDGHPEGRIGNNEIILSQCGIGKVNAAIGTMRLIHDHQPDCIISTGLAGGIDGSLKVMDIVVGSQTCYHDVWCGEGNQPGQVQGLPARFDACQNLLAPIKDLAKNNPQVRTGLICTGDQFITDKTKQNAIKEQFTDALACEMESAAIAHTCHLLNVPFLSIRVISDTPGNTDNHAQQWSDFLRSMGEHSFEFVHQYLKSLPDKL